jgi:hypothetical protein
MHRTMVRSPDLTTSRWIIYGLSNSKSCSELEFESGFSMIFQHSF